MIRLVNFLKHELDQATRYLQENNELRATLGIDDNAKLEPHVLGAGEHNENYWFADPATGQKYVLRINVVSQPFHKDQVAYEFEALRVLEPSGRAPKPLYVDSSKRLIDNGAMVIGFCEGQELDFDSLRPGDLERCIELMADIHTVDIPADCKLHHPSDSLSELFAECMQRYKIYRDSGFEEERITRWAERYIEAARRKVGSTKPHDPRHIVNTEALPSHFLIPHDPTSPEPGFFIDWERPIIGEVAQDIAYFTSPTGTFWDSEYLMPKQQTDELVERYWEAAAGRLDRTGFDKRFDAWKSVTALRSMMWCCKAVALRKADPNYYMTSKAIQKMPVYLSDEFLERVWEDCF